MCWGLPIVSRKDRRNADNLIVGWLHDHDAARAAASEGMETPSRRAIRHAWATPGAPYAEGSALEATTTVLLYAWLDGR